MWDFRNKEWYSGQEGSNQCYQYLMWGNKK